MSLKLKRDETSTNPPASGQLEVGELVMNSKTGKLYTKLSSGVIVEFVGRQVCYSAVPIIDFDDVSHFCCYGDTLSVKVNRLEASNTNYVFSVEELTDNGGIFNITTPAYNNYTENGQTFEEATVPLSGVIIGSDPISIIKFIVSLDNHAVTEKTVSICCKNCSPTT